MVDDHLLLAERGPRSVRTPQQTTPHSITSPARASSVGFVELAEVEALKGHRSV
jgi:hypothetical protein